ncbi:MAG: DUF4112 domain-containing protein [Asticcacaulis sp.]
MLAKTHDQVRRIYDQIGVVKRLSDRIIGIGPINLIGLDGILAWIPGAGPAYSVLAGAFILTQGVRARCDPVTLISAFIVLAIDSGVSLFDNPIIPIPSIIDTFFQGHLYAAHMIQKDIDKTHYVEGMASEAYRTGAHETHMATMRSLKGKKRIVYLAG